MRIRSNPLAFSLLFIVALAFAAHAQTGPAPGPGSGQLKLSGGQLTADGAPWTMKGVVLIGRLAPPKRLNQPFVAQSSRNAAAAFSPATLQVAKAFGANTVRFSASQGGLDPQDPIYDPAYADYLLGPVATARSDGLVTVIMMSAQVGSGEEHAAQMPTAGTVRAWQTVASRLCRGDNGLVFDLFAEPDGGAGNPGPADFAAWQSGMNAIIAALRAANCHNVLIVQPLVAGKKINPAYPLTDPDNNYVWGLHVYFDCGQCEGKALATPAEWAQTFGNECQSSYQTRRIPCMVSEWGIGSGAGNVATGCYGPQTPAEATNFLAWLQTQRPAINGITGWALDATNELMVGNNLTTPTDFRSFTTCKDTSKPFGAGQLLSQYFKQH